MLNVIDTATSQATLDFAKAFAEGWTDVYVKMGGDNVDTYVAPWYTRQVDRARAAGFRHVGHYWVPDGNPNDPDTVDTPTQQADYMVDRLHDWRKASDFIVLDNESLDGAVMFSDAQAAEFIERVKSRLGIPGRQVFMYGGWYDLAAHAWPAVLATGAMFIVADYRASSQPGMNFPDIPTVPRARIVGHQYGGRAVAGVVTDTNTFRDDAFDYTIRGDFMPTPVTHLIDGKRVEYLVTETAIHLIAPEHVGNDVPAYRAAYGPGVTVEGPAGMHAFMRATEDARAQLAREVVAAFKAAL